MSYKPSKKMQRHLEAVEKDPGRAMELSPDLRKELDALPPDVLGRMAQSVKYSRGEPIHLTDDENAAFRGRNQHLPSFSKSTGDGPVAIPRAPAGKYSMGPGGGGGADEAMSDAWAKFGGSFDEFKAHVFRPVPAELRIGKQEWLVQGCTAKDQVGVALLNGGSFNDPDAAMAHAKRLSEYYVYFDFHVVSQFAWVAMPPAEDTMRGIQRTYKDKNLDAIMKEHFSKGVEGKQRQLQEIREVEERKGPREEAEPEFPPTRLEVGVIDDDAPIGEVVARGES